MYETLTGTITPGQSGAGVMTIKRRPPSELKNWSIHTECSLILYSGHFFWERYSQKIPSATDRVVDVKRNINRNLRYF